MARNEVKVAWGERTGKLKGCGERGGEEEVGEKEELTRGSE